MKALVGCLSLIGGIVVLIIGLGMCSAASSVTQIATRSHQYESQSGNGMAACNNSVSHTNQAWKDFNAGDYQGGYNNANTAVHLADSCRDGGDRDSALGFALSARALNEHHLSVGDSRTDLNQAEQLLASCQSDVGYYGTHEAAVCETQEQNDISAQTDWEMNGE